MAAHKQETPSVLVIDDENDIRQLLSLTVERMGLNAVTAASVHEAKSILERKTFQLCLSDLKLPDGNGIDIVETIQREYTQTPVIVITAHGSVDIAIKAMKHGAFDFINKPVDLGKLRTLIENAIESNRHGQQQRSLDDIVGEAPSMLRLKERMQKVSRSQAPVFINGESGSGKELVARAIHKISSRAEKPFVPVNCGAIPSELVESEFFGHTKGSFSGAIQNKQGLFQAAHGGTLFLDEVADLPLEMQVKLLRAIQEKKVRPVGSQQEESIDVRILSATHKDLSDLVADNKFRSDLFYRINVIDISVPPLRHRTSDIPALTDIILKKIAKKNHSPVYSIDDTALDALAHFDFPGNIRELENILERASALCESNIIKADDLLINEHKIQSDGQRKPDHSITHPSTEELTPSEAPLPETSDSPDSNDATRSLASHYHPDKHKLDEYLEAIEKKIIIDILEKHRWNRTQAAKKLGITFRSLRYRLKKLGIDDD